MLCINDSGVSFSNHSSSSSATPLPNLASIKQPSIYSSVHCLSKISHKVTALPFFLTIISILYLQFISSAEMSQHESASLPIHGAKTEPRGYKGFAVMKAGVMGGGGGALGRGLAILDFILRLAAIIAALAATITMGTTNQTLNFFTQFFQFRARYYDLPAFSFFVGANAVASGYLVLSLPFSLVTIVRPQATGIKFLLLALDTVVLALTMAGAAAAAAIVYLAHQGNTKTNWVAICQQFGSFCQRVSGAVVASFIAATILMVLVILSAASIKRRN